jgi:uridine kinase
MRAATPQRDRVIADIAATVTALHPRRVIRVAIDGVDGAGKTVFADELADAITRPVIRAGVDGFHHPRRIRHRAGRTSPEGFFHDSHDYALLRRVLLDPLAPGGDGRHRTAAFDHRTDTPIDTPWQHAPADAVLVFDGIFLHRPELRDLWDHSVFLHVDFAVSVPRMAHRDGTSPGPAAHHRHIEGQRLYLSLCRPAEHASVVVDNNDLTAPRIIRKQPGTPDSV